MKHWLFILGLLISDPAVSAPVPTTPQVVDCVFEKTGSNCQSDIRHINTPAVSPNNYVNAAGYYNYGDAGGGSFIAQADNSCQTITATTAVAVTQGSIVVTIMPVAGITVGMSVNLSSPAVILPYDVITNVGVAGGYQTITLETPVSTTYSGTVTLTISPDNAGSVIADMETAPRCFNRATWQFNAREWGAFQDGASDDTVAVQSWLNSNQTSFMENIRAPQPHSAITGISLVSLPIVCPANTTIQGPSNLEGASHNPLFAIRANNSSGVFPSSSEVLDAYDFCRLSGVAIDGNHVATSVVVRGLKVDIDGFSALLNGNPYNLYCGVTQVSGLEVKNSYVDNADGENIYMPSSCANVRLVGDNIVSASGSVSGTSGRGIVFGGNDLTLTDGIVQQNHGAGLDLEGASMVSVTGMAFQQNGEDQTSAAIQIGGSGGTANYVSICGNHFYESGYGNNTITSHIKFGYYSDSQQSSNIEFCGNVYRADPNQGPAYVYGVTRGSSGQMPTPQNVAVYEGSQPQDVGVLTADAAAFVPQDQVLPESRTFITGLTLSNDNLITPSTKVDIAPGLATDSTGVSVIQIPVSGCKVDLAASGLNGLDTGSSLAATTTYFLFVVADEASPATTPGATPSCIGSESLTPNFGTYYGHGVYRLVGALYTDSASPTPHVVQFHQDNDIFYLANSVTDIQTGAGGICSVSPAGTLCALSVPCGRTASTTACPAPGFAVEAFGRIVGGTSAGNLLYLSSPSQANQAPANFPNPPGFTTANTVGIPQTFASAFPFHLQTDISGQLRVRSSATSPTAYEVTDGWVWHRQR